MADAVATFQVNLEDGTSGPAKDAANALKNLKSQIDGDKKALRELEAAFKSLNSAQVVNIQAAQSLKKQIAAKKQAIQDAQAAYVNLGGTFGKVNGQGKGLSAMLEKLREASASAPGPLATLITRMGGLRGLIIGGALVAGVVALAAAVVALGVAAVGAAVALGRYAISQADARRNELLRLEGLTKLRFWYGAAAGSAKELQAATDSVAAGVAIGRDQVAKYTDQLYRAGLRGGALAKVLEAVAIKASVQGEAAAGQFAGLAATMNLAGYSVDKLADKVKTRLGGIAARQMLSLSVQMAKAKESFDALFADLDLEPLLRGVKSVTVLFSQASESGKALKHLMGFMFQDMINSSETAGLYVRRFFQGMIIAALKTENVVLRLRLWFRDTFGSNTVLSKLDLTKAAVYAGAAAFGFLAAAVASTAFAVGALVVGLVALTALAVGPFYLLYKAAEALWNFFADTDWSGLGSAIVSGIVKGLKAGVGWLKSTMQGLATSAYKAFKDKLGIASPSKEFAKLGLTLPQGVAQGVERGTPLAQDAVAAMVRIPAIDPMAPGVPGVEPAAGAGRAPVTVTVDVGGISLQSAATDAPGITADLEAQLAQLFERLALQLGAKLQGA